MLRETQTDRATDSVERIGPKQEFHLRDSTEGEMLVWKKVSPNNRMIRSLEELTGMLGHAIYEKSKKVEKQFKKMKKF